MLLYDWLAYLLFFAKPGLVSHIIREPIIVKLLTSEIWFDGRMLALSAYISGKFLIKKKTSIALQLHVFVLPKPYADFHDRNLTHMCLVVALSFIKLCDPSEMSFILV